MTTLTLDTRTRTPFHGGRSVLPGDDLHLFGDGGGEATLADVVASAWEDLTAARAVDCPVCHGELAPRIISPAGDVVAARCTDCGTELD